jgi:hypothetical protein
MKHGLVYLCLSWMALIGLLAPGADGQVRKRVDGFTRDTIAQCEDILGSVTDDRSLRAAVTRASTLADTVWARAGNRQQGAAVRAESVLGVLELVSRSGHPDPGGMIELFAQSPGFVVELGLLVDPKDKALDVVRVAGELMSERLKAVEAYPALAAAVCVVHDLPIGTNYSTRVNENTAKGASSLEVFDFFVNNARTMYLPPDQLPGVDLVFVVDVSESIDQLQWAHDTYRTSPGIDQRFFEIVYDYEHYLQGKDKKVTVAGNYSLTQIKKYGGVCADQAYFAMSVAKACGIPSAYVVAKGADVSHAWVGYFESRGRRGEWNFDAGRYEEYQNLRGNIRDPQTGEYIADGRVGVLDETVKATSEQIHHALASGRVVDRMTLGHWHPDEGLGLDTKGNLRRVRTDSVADRLDLLKQTLGKCAGLARVWDRVIAIAMAGDMDERDLDVWARAALQLAGRHHQDFSFDFLAHLITTIEDTQRQHEMWEWAFGQYRSRPDLAAAVRFEQGQLWDANDKPDMAWIAYQDVLDNFLNDGPMCDDALSAMGKLLAKNGKRDAYLDLLQVTAKKVIRPDDMATNFAKQSNYYKVHWRLAKELEYHNRMDEARRIRDMINMPADE